MEEPSPRPQRLHTECGSLAGTPSGGFGHLGISLRGAAAEAPRRTAEEPPLRRLFPAPGDKKKT